MRQSKNIAMMVAIAVGSFMWGYANRGTDVYAETRKSAPRVAFQSGSERSLAILQKIEQRLQSIDGRLERFEKSLPATK